jgi:hypothetical protein
VEPYKGLCPSNIARDAKYSVSAAGEIRLTYHIDAWTRDLLTTDDHPTLAKMVNAVKRKVNGRPGGVFYINEFSEVIVPGKKPGVCHRAGIYDGLLEFELDGRVVSPRAPSHLRPGDDWPGPHVGVAYLLCAGGDDIRYELRNGNRITSVRLSGVVGEKRARETAARVSAVKGSMGGRFYINEQCELFAPVLIDGSWRFLYIGHLEDSAWFDPPEM